MDETYWVFEFSDEAEAKHGAHRIRTWAQAFKLSLGQLRAVVEPQGRHRLLVRLTFGPGEELSYRRWCERIPSEEPFKNAKGSLVEPISAAYGDIQAVFSRLSQNGG